MFEFLASLIVSSGPALVTSFRQQLGAQGTALSVHPHGLGKIVLPGTLLVNGSYDTSISPGMQVTRWCPGLRVCWSISNKYDKVASLRGDKDEELVS